MTADVEPPCRTTAEPGPARVSSLPPAGGALPALTSIRFLAAVAVVLSHVLGGFATTQLGPGWNAKHPGLAAHVRVRLTQVAALGVLGPNLFFVLSGVVLYWAYAATGRLRSHGRPAFFFARFARLAPLYVCGLLLGLAALGLRLTCPEGGLACTRGRGPLSLAASAVVQQGWLPWSADATNGPSWTLSTEFLFYLCFPLAVVAMRRLSARATTAVLIGSLLLCQWWLVAGRVLPPRPATYTGNAASEVWYLAQRAPVMHLPEFVAGLALGRLLAMGRVPRVSARVAVGVTVATPVLLAFVAVYGRKVVSTPVTMIGSAGGFDVLFCALIAVLAPSDVSALRHPRLLLLGEASYALYITHWPIWFLMVRWSPFDLHHLEGFALWAVVYLATVVSVSVLSFRYVERPCRRALTAWWRGRFHLAAS